MLKMDRSNSFAHFVELYSRDVSYEHILKRNWIWDWHFQANYKSNKDVFTIHLMYRFSACFMHPLINETSGVSLMI